MKEIRTCRCGESSGQYTDRLNAWYSGESIPIGFANRSIELALQNQPESGQGERFEAFVIPKQCDTFKHIVDSNKKGKQ